MHFLRKRDLFSITCYCTTELVDESVASIAVYSLHNWLPRETFLLMHSLFFSLTRCECLRKRETSAEFSFGIIKRGFSGLIGHRGGNMDDSKVIVSNKAGESRVETEPRSSMCWTIFGPLTPNKPCVKILALTHHSPRPHHQNCKIHIWKLNLTITSRTQKPLSYLPQIAKLCNRILAFPFVHVSGCVAQSLPVVLINEKYRHPFFTCTKSETHFEYWQLWPLML